MTAPTQKNKPSCDCLNFCGDDPDIHNKKVKPCAGYVRFHPDICRVNKLVPEDELIPVYQDIANRALKSAEKSWHNYCTLLPVGDQRTATFEVFENIRNAGRIQ
jgi:hypothetical protein